MYLIQWPMCRMEVATPELPGARTSIAKHFRDFWTCSVVLD